MTVTLDLGPLVKARLLLRYKRFLADAILMDGTPITAHCPNTGAMDTCMAPGCDIYLSRSGNPKRKYVYTWELSQMPDSLVGINTLNANRLVKLALNQSAIPEIKTRGLVKPEVKIGNSRLDFMITGAETLAYIEVKNCTLARDGIASFPDAATLRGQKHLRELAALVHRGHEAVIFYVIQRMDAGIFRPAFDVDPTYARILREVHRQGVKIVAYDTAITPGRISLGRSLAFDLAF